MTQSTFSPKGVVSIKAGGTVGQYEPVKLNSTQEEVVVTTGTTDLVYGVSLIDGVDGDMVSIARSGSVLMRCGSGGVTLGNLVGIDSSDKTEIAAITESGTGTTLHDIIGQAEQTGASNALVVVGLRIGRTLI